MNITYPEGYPSFRSKLEIDSDEGTASSRRQIISPHRDRDKLSSRGTIYRGGASLRGTVGRGWTATEKKWPPGAVNDSLNGESDRKGYRPVSGRGGEGLKVYQDKRPSPGVNRGSCKMKEP